MVSTGQFRPKIWSAATRKNASGAGRGLSPFSPSETSNNNNNNNYNNNNNNNNNKTKKKKKKKKNDNNNNNNNNNYTLFNLINVTSASRKQSMKLNWNFLGKGGGSAKQKPVGRSMDFFQEVLVEKSFNLATCILN